MKLKCKSTVNRMIGSSERGSSSVLVVMIMLLLITFGVLAMISSYSNLKISRKHAEWTKDYYRLESMAESDLMAFTGILDEVVERFRSEPFDLIQLLEVLINDLHEHTAFAGKINSNVAKPVNGSLEDVVPKLSILTQDAETGRRLFIELSFDPDIDKIDDFDFTISEWREIPVEFEYEDALNFNDPGGN